MKNYFPNYLRVPVIFFLVFGIMEYLIDSGSQPAIIRYPIVMLFLAVVLLILIAIEIVVSAIDNISWRLLSEDQRREREAAQSLPISQRQWYKTMMKRLTKSEPIESEQQLLLHHDYDGIKELDNNLPPWWTYLFYGCIVFAAVYMVHFEFMGGQSQEAEFEKEMQEAKLAVEEYKKNAPDLMDEKTVTLLTDKAELEKGKAIYETSCAACHRQDGGGQIGPNLTDEHWILGGGIKSIFQTISNGGRDGKGMVSWRGTLKPQEIQHVASYIISLQGSAPKDGKAAEGDILWSGNTETASVGATASSAGKSLK